MGIALYTRAHRNRHCAGRKCIIEQKVRQSSSWKSDSDSACNPPRTMVAANRETEDLTAFRRCYAYVSRVQFFRSGTTVLRYSPPDTPSALTWIDMHNLFVNVDLQDAPYLNVFMVHELSGSRKKSEAFYQRTKRTWENLITLRTRRSFSIFLLNVTESQTSNEFISYSCDISSLHYC